MTISAHTLMMAIKATASKVAELAVQLETSEDPELSHLEEEIHSYSKAQTELKGVYVELQKQSQNLPSYKELID